MEDTDQSHQETITQINQDVSTFGYHVAMLDDDGYLPAFVYSIGLYETYGHPEIIIFGLRLEMMSGLLQHLAETIKNGTTYAPDKDYDGIFLNYPVQFLSVNKAHYPDYLGYGAVFYKSTFDFPTIQLVWTDKEGQFPWDDNFFVDWKFKQPLLDRNTDFKFYEERTLGVFTTKATLEGLPIVRVYHNDDGDWQFHSEEEPAPENTVLVSLESLVLKDQSLNDIHHLNYGQFAIRTDAKSPWQLFDEGDFE